MYTWVKFICYEIKHINICNTYLQLVWLKFDRPRVNRGSPGVWLSRDILQSKYAGSYIHVQMLIKLM